MVSPERTVPIHRGNIETVFNAGLYVAITNGRWYEARKNGQTKLWARAINRIRISFKYGFKGYGTITEADFDGQSDGCLSPLYFRHINDVPKELCP